jgi:hypothetical protein
LYKVLVEKPEGKGTLERYRRRWEGNIMSWSWKNSVGGHGLDSLAQNKAKRRTVLNAVIDAWIPRNAGVS